MILIITELDIDNVELCVDKLTETVAVHIPYDFAWIILLKVLQCNVLINCIFRTLNFGNLLLELWLVFLCEKQKNKTSNYKQNTKKCCEKDAEETICCCSMKIFPVNNIRWFSSLNW